MELLNETFFPTQLLLCQRKELTDSLVVFPNTGDESERFDFGFYSLLGQRKTMGLPE